MAYFNFDDPNKRYEEAANQINLPKSILEAYQERRLQTEQLRQDQARTSLANYTQQLRAGDYSALTSIAAINPQAAQEARLGLERRDNVAANIASQFLRTDISRKPERYQESLAQLASMGVDVGKFPNTYSPDRAEEAMRWFVDQSKSNTDLLKEQGEQLKNRELEAKIRNEAIMARKHEQEILTNRALQEKYEVEAQKDRLQSKAPSGFFFNESGGLEPIPGSKADLERREKRVKAETSAENLVLSMDTLKENLAELKSHPGLEGITGISGKIFNVPGRQAANAEVLFDTIKGEALRNVITAMKQFSATGATGLGNVNILEAKAVQDSFAALKKSQSTEEFKKNLDKAITTIERQKELTQSMVDKIYYPDEADKRAEARKKSREELEKINQPIDNDEKVIHEFEGAYYEMRKKK